MKRGLIIILVCSIGISFMSSCASDVSKGGGQEPLPQPDDLSVIADYVDFTVDVPEGRDVRVLQLTDIQTISGEQRRYPGRITDTSTADTVERYKKYIGQVIERCKPDLIIMTGDNVYGEFDDSGERFLEMVEFMESYRIPWAPVLGNHDAETFMGVDWMCDIYEKAEYCLFKQRTLTGNGNYTVGITQGGRLLRVFYMLDSNGCDNVSRIPLSNGHTTSKVGFGDDQIEWYNKSIKALKIKYPNTKLSMAFHIQIQAFHNAMKPYGFPGDIPIDLDKNAEAKKNGAFGYIGSPLKSPWDQSSAVWNDIRKLGIDSVFVGHEHKNSASVIRNGVRLTYGQKSSSFDRYNSDENGPVVGGTYFEISNKDGSIKNAGLRLYDHELGYDSPNAKPLEGSLLKYENIPDNATVTVLDFGSSDVDPSVRTAGISSSAAFDTSAAKNLPEGFEGNVYGFASTGLASIGVKFSRNVNADKLLGLFIKMYVSDYTVTEGKTPVVRIYNDKDNSILSEIAFGRLGGKSGEWVYVNILDMIKESDGIVDDGKINPLSFVYRFYGTSMGTAYFDSVILVSDGDPYVFDSASAVADTTVIKGEECTHYALDELNGNTAFDGKGILYTVNEESYSVSFSYTPNDVSKELHIIGYTGGADKDNGLTVSLKADSVAFSDFKADYDFESGTTYDVEVGFANLHENGNTVCAFIKINGKLVGWELLEAFGFECGNVAFYSDAGLFTFNIK